MFDDDEAVFGVLKGGDEESADDTEDKDVALHRGLRRTISIAYTRRSTVIIALQRLLTPN